MKAVSPCVDICTLNNDKFCLGCLRHINEIAQWSTLSEQQKHHFMKKELPQRHYQQIQSSLYQIESPPLLENGHIGWNFSTLNDISPENNWIEAAVLVGLIWRENQFYVVFTKRNEDLRHHAGQVSFPGGRAEADDASILATALRECYEETNIPPELFQPLGYLEPLVTISGFRVTPVVAIIKEEYSATPNPAEVSDIFEVPLHYLLNPDNLKMTLMMYRGLEREVFEYHWPTHRIWGVTAAILFNLQQRLKGNYHAK